MCNKSYVVHINKAAAEAVLVVCIKQLAFYHTVLNMYKILKSDKPMFLRNKLTRDFPYLTRQATGGHVRYAWDTVVEGSFLSSGAKDYNLIPENFKTITTLHLFKRKLKLWILSNIPVEL